MVANIMTKNMKWPMDYDDDYEPIVTTNEETNKEDVLSSNT